MKISPVLIILTCSFLLLNGCKFNRILSNEKNGNALALLKAGSSYEHIIQTDDKIRVSIWDHSEYSVGSVYSVNNTNESYGKWVLVNKNGFIPLPEIGFIKIAGLSCTQAQEKLKTLYGKKLVDPIIAVQVLNKEFTILGEISSPGNYLLEKENNSLVEVIGRAQGFSTYANLKKIQLLRYDTSYTIDFTRLNEDILHKIIIKSGDVIIIPEKGAKRVNLNTPTMIAFSSAITAIVLVLSILSQP